MAGSQKDTVFRKLIDALFEQQRAEWAAEGDKRESGSTPSPAFATREAVSNWRWREINEAKLQSILSQISDQPLDFASENLIMFLPPFPKEERGFVPAVSLYFDAPRECLEIRVVMIERDEDGSMHGLGFRIESPTSNCSGQSSIGAHDFYHVQLIKELGYGPDLRLPGWLPCIQPAFALDARTPVDAILNLMLSLYGLDYFRSFLNNHRNALTGYVSPFLKALPSARRK